MSMTQAATVKPPKAESEAESAVLMQGVNKWFGDFHVLRDINLDVKRGERVVLRGQGALADGMHGDVDPRLSSRLSC